MKTEAAISRAGTSHPDIEEVELDTPRSDEVLVRIVATGICHTDLNTHEGKGWPGPKPIVLGHEGAGIVEQIGVGVRGLAPGDHVVLSGGSCGLCPSCRAGRPTYCEHAMPLAFGGCRLDGSTPIHQHGQAVGGNFFGQSSFARHAIVPERTAVKVPEDVPLHLLGPLACGIITGAGSVLEAFRLRPGQSLAVFGVGSVGLAAVMAAKLAGAAHIAAIDVSDARLALARDLGATITVQAGPDVIEALRAALPTGFTFSFNTTSVPEVYDAALACLAVEGTAGFVTRPNGAWAPAMMPMLAGGRKLQGILGGSANPQLFIPLMIDYWRQGRFPFDRLISTFAFNDIAEAWRACEAGEVVKPVLLMDAAAWPFSTASGHSAPSSRWYSCRVRSRCSHRLRPNRWSRGSGVTSRMAQMNVIGWTCSDRPRE